MQRCLFHLVRGATWLARYKDRHSKDFVDGLRARLDDLLTTAYRDHDLDTALDAYDQRALKAAGHRERALAEVFTFLTHLDAARLLFGDKGGSEFGTGVLERAIRELKRRTDVGVRWSIEGVRAALMIKLQRKYRHGPWSPDRETDDGARGSGRDWAPLSSARARDRRRVEPERVGVEVGIEVLDAVDRDRERSDAGAPHRGSRQADRPVPERRREGTSGSSGRSAVCARSA